MLLPQLSENIMLMISQKRLFTAHHCNSDLLIEFKDFGNDEISSDW